MKDQLFCFFHLWNFGSVVCRDDTEADNAFLGDSGSQYNCVVGIIFSRTTPPLFNQVLNCYVHEIYSKLEYKLEF